MLALLYEEIEELEESYWLSFDLLLDSMERNGK